MSKLPPGWAFIAIDEVTAKPAQKIPSEQENFLYIDIGSVDRETKKIYNFHPITGKNAPSRARQVVKAGDVLVSMTRPNLNAVALIPDSLDGQIASTGFDVLRPLEVESRWLFFAVRTKDFVDLMSDLVQGALYPAVRPRDIRRYEIPLPPLPEQKRIADKLDAVLARVDSARARLDKIPALLKRFRQSVLAAATSGALTEEWRKDRPCLDATDLLAQLINDHLEAGGHTKGNASTPTENVHNLTEVDFPTKWRIVTLRDACAPGRPITYGILKPGPELPRGVPYVRVADFPGNRLNLSNIKNTSTIIDEQFRRSRLIGGDLLLSIRGSVGRLIEIPKSLTGANITQDTARLSISPRILRAFARFALLSESSQRRIRLATRGVAVRGINIGDVRALQIPLPPLEEQHEIVRRVESLFAIADRIQKQYEAAKVKIDKLAPALLAKAFRGELVPQDPNDEPASVMLARLRAEKSNTIKKSRNSQTS